MVITKTPFRISFFGGGTDYPGWYKENPGAVLATTIDKYCYITCRYLPPFFEHKSRIAYSFIELVKNVSDIKHPSVRECLKFTGIKKGIEIHHDGDLPARTGIGSSSSFTVGLLHGLNALKGKMVSKMQLALDSIYVEQNMIKENVGSQDQASASFGGLNLIKFGGEEHIEVEPVCINYEKIKLLESHLMLFFTGLSRTASEIAEELVKKISTKRKELKEMFWMVDESVKILTREKCDLSDFGRLLGESWKIKRNLSGRISLQEIDDIYSTAIRAGALGGKLLGAGGGGFILFFAKPEIQPKIKAKLKNLLYVPFQFENLGSQIIFYKPDDV